MPSGRYHAGTGPGALQDGVRADRRAMPESLRPGEQLGQGQAHAVGELGQPGQDAIRRIALGRQRLRCPICRGAVGRRMADEDAVSESAADVDADLKHQNLHPLDLSIDRSG
jgi:hypothetical protein